MKGELYRLEVTVDQQCINKGVRNRCRHCPIALAIQKKFHEPVDVAVGARSISVDTDNDRFIYNVPYEATSFISYFDRLGPIAVVPRTFVFELSSHLDLRNHLRK